MFNTASPTHLHGPAMVLELNTASSFKRKSSYSLQDEYESGRSASMQRVDSHDSKRRRTPMGTDILLLQSPIRTNEVLPAVSEHLREPLNLHHPFTQQFPPQSLQLHSVLPDYTHGGQQGQLNTPPLESSNGFQTSGQPSNENRDVDDDMIMEDDCQSAYITTDRTTTINHFTQHHSHTAPPSPVPPTVLPADSYDDTSNDIKWEGTKHKGYPRDAYEDPNKNLWTGGRVLRKNMDGQVKGYKMGYLEGCEKCRARDRGHFGHFIMADSI
ncbi:hypothetical protein EV426DRAFT_699974 [Tirmania nivea]|nr:hypothetical protein EV426DRAFT_699974 [Tirmania nivea]